MHDGLRRTAGRARSLLAWLAILGSVAVLASAVVVPRLGGATPYTVLTGSMAPGLPPGTLVVSRPADPRTIGIGDVVTYQLVSGRPEVVTHRVIGVSSDSEGSPLFRTQGDANTVPDQKWVRPEQVRGTLWYSLPYLGRLNTLISGDQRQLALQLVAGALGAYSLLMLTAGVRDRRRRRPLTPPGPSSALPVR